MRKSLISRNLAIKLDNLAKDTEYWVDNYLGLFNPSYQETINPIKFLAEYGIPDLIDLHSISIDLRPHGKKLRGSISFLSKDNPTIRITMQADILPDEDNPRLEIKIYIRDISKLN